MKRSLRKSLSLLMAFLMTMTSVFPAFAADELMSQAAHVMISQIYASSGYDVNSTYKNDFVELYNPTSAPVNLSTWSVQYAAAETDPVKDLAKTYAPVPLTGVIQPGKYYLVQFKSGGEKGASLPTPEASCTIDLSGTKGKVALASKTTAISGATDPAVVDLVGYGTATIFEGKAAPGMTVSAGIVRKTEGVDTDNNFNDFISAKPEARNGSWTSAPVVETKCATPTASKASGMIDVNTVVDFATTTSGAAIEFNTVSTTSSSWTSGSAVTVSKNASYYVRAIKNGFTNSDVATFTYTVKDPNQVMTVKDALTLTGTTENVTVKGTLAYFATTYSNPVIYSVVDGKTYALYVFGAAPKGAKKGDVVKLKGKYEIRYGMPQLSGITVSSIEAEAGAVVTPKEMTITDILANGSTMLGQVVKIKDVTLGDYVAKGNTPVTDKANKTINIYNATPYPVQVLKGDVVDLYAMVAQNNSTIQLYTGTREANGFSIYDVTNDTKAPIITLNDVYPDAKPGVDYTISVKAEDNKGVQIVKISYTIGAKTISDQVMAYSPSTSEYKFVVPSSEITMKSESIIFKVAATDVTGLKTETAAKTIIVDSKPQFITLRPTRSGITGEDKSPVIAVTLGNAGNAPEVKMTLTKNKVAIAENKIMTAAATANVFEYKTSNLADGQYNVTVNVKREDGVTNSVNWNFTVGTPSSRPFFGQLHAHTGEYSDGSGLLSDGLKYIQGIPQNDKVDFVAFTDHSNFFDTKEAANPAEAMNDSSKMTAESLAKWNKYTASMRTFNDANAGSVVAFPGFEMTWSGGPGHINTFNSKGLVSRNNTVLNTKTADTGLRAYYDELIKNPDPLANLSQFNHPGATFGTFADFAYLSPTIDNKMVAVEVGNGEGAIGSGGYFPSYAEYTKALDKGWHVGPSNNQDNHKSNWGNANTSRTVIITNELSENGLLNGLKNKSMYATEDKNLNIQYTVNGQPLGTIINEVPTKPLQLSVVVEDPDSSDAISKIDIVTNSGRIAATKQFTSNSAEWNLELPPVQGYYYVRVTQADKNIAVTSPVWIGQAPRVGITSVVSGTGMPVTGEKMTLSSTLFNNEAKAVTLKSIEYKSGETILKSEALGTEMGATTSFKHTFDYTPSSPGKTKITVTAVMVVDSQERVFTQDIEIKVRDNEKLVYIGIDASHYNEYVRGNYKASMGNFANMAVNYDVRVVELETSEALIAATQNSKYKMLILTPPTRRNGDNFLIGYKSYTDEEIDAIKKFAESGRTIVVSGWSDHYENYTKFSDNTPHKLAADKHMSAQQNKLLAAIGSTIRISDDAVQDNKTNGGQPYRLYLNNYNMDNPLLKDVVPTEQVFSHYGGASVYAVDKNNNPTAILPATVSPMVYGFTTTESVDNDKDGVTVASGSAITVPKYSDKLMVAASENVAYANGKTSTVIVAGAAFMSNFEIQVTLDSYATPAYSNYTILENVVLLANPVVISDISKAHAAKEGETFTIQGIVTSNSTDADKHTAFVNTMYVQDATDGIDLYPITGTFKVGQTVLVTGVTSSYKGERQLSVQKIKIVDESIKPLPKPIKLSTADAAKSVKLGSLVSVTGVIQKFEFADGAIESIYIADSSKRVARVFIDGYITKDTKLVNLEVGAEITAVGLSSIDEHGSRIRVRNRADIGRNYSSGNGGSSAPSSTTGGTQTPQVVTPPQQTAVTTPDPSKATTAKTADQVAKETKANEIKQKVSELNKDAKDNKELKKALKSATDNVVDKSAVQKMIVQEKNSSKLKSAEFTELVKTARQEVKTLEKELNSKKTLELTIPITVQKNNTLALDASIIQTLKSQEVFVEVNSELGKLIVDGKKITTESLDIQLSEASKTAEVMVNGVKKSSKAVEVKITSNNVAVTQQSNMILPIEANKQTDQLMMMKFNPETNTWDKVKSVVTEEGLKASVNNGVYTIVEVTSTQFKDVNKHWASQVIQKLETRGVMNGVAADQFKPDATITKGEFLAAVLNNYGVDTATKGANWVDGYLAEASKQGINIVTAKDSNKAITREEMALIIAQAYKAYEGVTPDASAGAFKDLKKVNESSQQAINLMKTLGIVNGYSDGSFKPETTGTRAEAAQMLFKLMTVSN